MAEELTDVSGGEHLLHKYGERFKGWYFFKDPLRKETLPLNYPGHELTYTFTVSKFQIRFIIPSKIEFVNGIISYSDAERHLGIFRYPRDEKGDFTSPMLITKISDTLTVDDVDLSEILKRKYPLVFEAFKIPRYGFDYLDISDFNFKEIQSITDEGFVASVIGEYENIYNSKIEEIKVKILSSANYLLILENTLNRLWKNYDEVALATNNIIHI